MSRPNPDTPTDASRVASSSDDRAFAASALRAEAQAIERIQLDERFDAAVGMILAALDGGGSVVVSGMGKSGLIGQKLSATFASTGTHSHYIHPSEAMHGDLGRVRSQDVVLLLSFGGNTEEVVALATLLRQDAVATIGVVRRVDCDLGRVATLALPVGDVVEACPLNLAPSASTTAMMALGDALALTVSRRRNFSADEFRKNHPGGSLGRQLTPVTRAMRFRVGENLPLMHFGMTVRASYDAAEPTLAHVRRAGAMLVVDDAGRLAGIFTDGDLRRLVMRAPAQAMDMPIERVMTPNPRRLRHDAMVRDAVQIIREHRIDEVPVVDEEHRPVGLIDVQDLMALKVIE